MHILSFATHPFVNTENKRSSPSFWVQDTVWVSSTNHCLHHILFCVLETQAILFVTHRFTQVKGYWS
jgi:hypothetical protein